MELTHHHEHCRKGKLVKFIVSTTLKAATLAAVVCAVHELTKLNRHAEALGRGRR